jgi:hypothetical protein
MVSLDPDLGADSESGLGSRQAKIHPKNRKKDTCCFRI